MALSKEEILDAISEMSVIDIVDLISAMEEKFGVSAAAPVAMAAPAAGGGDAGADEAEDDAPVDVHLSEVGDKKVDVIKAVRAITGLGLKDAKALVDEAPSVIKEGVDKAMQVLQEAHSITGGDIISAGGTGTFDLNELATEIQAGSFLFMDTRYSSVDLPFEESLTIVSTIISIEKKQRR